MYSDLSGKVVVVTGGASGIGLATAKRFAEEGSKVMIIDYNAEALQATLSENGELFGGVQADVSSPDQVEKAFTEIDQKAGSVDVLISNAGISVRHPFMDIEYEQWSKMVNINLGGMFLCAREAAKRMKPRKSGVILMTASTNGTEGHPFYADYNSSKAGVILLAKTMALELAPYIRVNSICPGYVLTPMQKAEYTPEMLEQTNEGIPMKRHAEPEEIAALFAFLASDQAAYITGSSIHIDGGETAGLM